MRRTRCTSILALLVAVVLASMQFPLAPAAATTQSQSVPLSFSGNRDDIALIDSTKVCDECAPDDLDFLAGATGYGGHIGVFLDVAYDAGASLGVSYDDALLEEGQTLDVTNTLVPLPGTLQATARYEADYGFFQDADGIAPGEAPEWTPVPNPYPVPAAEIHGSFTASGSTPCVLPLPGDAPKTCTIAMGSVTLASVEIVPVLFSISLRAALELDVELTADGLTTVRQVRVNGGDTLADGALAFSGPAPASLDDPVDVPCGPAGKTLVYDVGDSTYESTMDLNNALVLQLVFTLVGGDIPLDLVDLAQIIHNGESLDLAADGATLELGPIAADATAPVLAVAESFEGDEGEHVPFVAGANDGCGEPTVAWTFSDGGSAFGEATTHRFADDGPYSGQVTATDFRGNTSTATFGVDIDNRPPVAYAGPDTTSVWGVPVAFDGLAVDPGSADQSTLLYRWTFGDGSPSASSGPGVSHVYAAAGDYTATLQVRDDEGAWSAVDERTIHVTKRTTATAYTGARSGLPKKAAPMSASVVDQLGRPVPGRTVKFTVGTQTVTATTGQNGVATASLKLEQKSGPYTLTTALVLSAGEGQYLASSDTVSFTIGK